MKLLKKGLPIFMSIPFMLCCPTILVAQKNDRPISQAEKSHVLDKAFSLLHENYIFPEVVNPMEKNIRKKFADGKYAGFNTAMEFIKNINYDFESLGNDRHLNIFYDPLRVKQVRAEKKDTAVQNFDPAFLARAKFENNMVRKAERMEGNVGYLKLDLFVDVRISKPTIVAAMNFLSNSDGLIIDLRQNGGGHASTVNFLLNYFLPDSTLTSRFTSRMTKNTTNIYTEHDPVIRKFQDNVPVYILVSKRTSSAAEAFAYTLQAFKRSVIVGDTTNGEANPGYVFILNDDMVMMIPTSVNQNVMTKTNWQGVGVIPDILARPPKALDAALAAIYNDLSITSKEGKLKETYSWLSMGFNAKVNPITPGEKELQSLVGNYAHDRKITISEKELYYERAGGNGKKKLWPLTHNIFELEGSPFFRVKFIKNDKGETIALEAMYDDGEREISKKL